MLGPSGVRFEPVEYAILGFRPDTRAMIGHGEYDRTRASFRDQGDGIGRRRETDRI